MTGNAKAMGSGPRRRAALAIVLLAVACMLSAPPLAAQYGPERDITPINGDLYRFKNKNHYSVFLVTEEGVLLTDPINAEAAQWLKAEIETRFHQPVRYVVYSHEHPDHISGGEVFADTATFISHERTKAAIVAKRHPTQVPTVTFTERHTVALGGRRIELIYLGRNHSDNNIVVHFPEERTVYAVDFVAAERMPYRDFPDSYLDEWPDSLERLEAMDFDILATAHGPMGTREDARKYRIYLAELRAQVSRHLADGASPEEIKRLVTMDAYRDWGAYDAWRELNVAGMIRHLQGK